MKLDLIDPPQLVIFSTRDFARREDISVAAASKRLARLKHDNRSLVQLTRGVWANASHPHFSPLACVPLLLGAEQGYVSFLTALHLRGALSQIPASIQVATTGHSRRLRTAFATFEFLQLKPEMFVTGIEWSETPLPFRMATVEKALFDALYISTRKNRRFARLPELELREAGFRLQRYRALMHELDLPPQIATAIKSRLNTLYIGERLPRRASDSAMRKPSTHPAKLCRHEQAP